MFTSIPGAAWFQFQVPFLSSESASLATSMVLVSMLSDASYWCIVATVITSAECILLIPFSCASSLIWSFMFLFACCSDGYSPHIEVFRCHCVVLSDLCAVFVHLSKFSDSISPLIVVFWVSSCLTPPKTQNPFFTSSRHNLCHGQSAALLGLFV